MIQNRVAETGSLSVAVADQPVDFDGCDICLRECVGLRRCSLLFSGS